MKKLITFIVFLVLFGGCNELMNSPTKKVEEFFNRYQTLDDSLLNNLDYSIESNNLNEEEKNMYRNIMKRQYKDLTYKIKDEEIDGDLATVKVEIEVYDYSLASINASEYFKNNQDFFLNEEGEVDTFKYTDYKLDLMKDINERVKYTLDITVRKKDKTWMMDNISRDDLLKIHGVYSY